MKKTIIVATLVLGTFLYAVYSDLKSQTYLNYQTYKLLDPQINTYPDTVENVSNSVVAPAGEKIEVVNLNVKNTIVFRGPVTSASIATFQKNILEETAQLSRNDVLYMVIDSPGGSVIDGGYLIDTVKALPQKVKTISVFSASMAFQMVQNFDERLITPSGTLMSHRASGGFEGEFGGDGKGELITRLNWILKILKAADENAAYRMKMSLNDYQKLIQDEYWASGKDAVKDKAADRMVLVKCEDSLVKKVETVTIKSFFGSADLNFSGCPIITYPISVDMKFDGSIYNTNKEEFERFINKLILDKRAFVKDYIVTNKIEGIVK